MAKLLSRIFRSRSSSAKGRSPHGSQQSIDDNSRFGGQSSGMRPSSSMDNLTSYYINPKELEKSKLHKASWEGNINKVRSLASPGQIDAKDQHSRTPLHLAVVQGHFEIVRHLVHEGAKLDVVDSEKRTPLLKAVLSCSRNPELSYHICRCIIEGGGDAFINAVDIHKRNALHYAVAFVQEDLVDYFLSIRTCDPNFRDGNEMTPLHLAVDRKSANIVRILLSDQHQQHADPNLTARSGYTPLHMAALTGDQEIVQELLQADLEEPCDPTILDSQQLTAFALAQMNRHEQCAKLIEDYQRRWTTSTNSRRKTSATIDEQTINHRIMDPSQRLDDDDEETSHTTRSSETSSSSTPSLKPDRRPSNPLSERTVSSTSAVPKPEPRSLADLIKRNPVQPNGAQANVPKANNQAMSSLLNSNPLQPDGVQANVPKASNQTMSSLVNNNPLQPNGNVQSRPATAQQKQPSLSTFGIGSVPPAHIETDHTSTSVSIERSIVGANPLVAQPSAGKKNVTISALANAIPQVSPRDSTSNSWTHDTASAHEQKPITAAKKVDNWDDDSTTQSDDEDTGVYRANLATTNFPKQQISPGLNALPMFTTTPRADNTDDSRSDEDSIEAAVRKQNTQKPSTGIQSIVNKQIGSSYTLPQPSSIPLSTPAANEDSSWSEDSITPNKQSAIKGVTSLIQQQPLHNQKPNVPTLDDSRPLSADLKRQSVKSTSTTSTTSDDTDDELNEKAATIVRSPFANGAVSSLVHATVRPTEPAEAAPTGVENLLKIISDIKHSPNAHLKQSTSPKTISKLVSPSILQRSDSLSSTASSLLNDTGANGIKQQFHHDDVNGRHWSATTTTNRYDYELLARKDSNEMIQQSHRQLTRASIHHDLNNLRGSMSSSTSSIQNNMERISELKEDIKQIERKQEDSLELKRQLKDMEIKKNNFEALYKKNDQLLRETESKLEKEIGEKQRLEWTTKNLNMELKSIKQRLEGLEDEKDLLNQRCLKLKEERDNYDEKLRVHQVNSLQTAATGVLREEDIEKIKSRHREEMKLLSAENDDLHQRTKQLQSDLQLHKESLDVTIRYKIDLEKALEEKLFLQRELDRLKHEKDFIEQEKTDYKTKYDHLHEEIRALILDRSRLEQKLTHELEEQTKQTQRSTDDSRKYKAQIEQLNLKLGDAEARLLVLQTRNEALLAPKDREINSEFETLKQRLDLIESEKRNAEQRYHNERQEITTKQQLQQQQTPNTVHEPLMILTSSPLSTGLQQQQSSFQHSPSSTCMKCDTLQRNFDQEREQRLQTQRDNERLRDTVSRQEQQQHQLAHSFQQHQHSDQLIVESNNRIRSDNERMKYELDRLRQDFDKLVANYDPSKYVQSHSQQQHHHQQPLVSQADGLRQLYDQELREKQLLLSKLIEVSKTPQPPPAPATKPTSNGYHLTSSSVHSHHHHHDYDHLFSGKSTCSICSNGRLLRERLENAIDISLADQRIQTIKQIPILPRPTSAPSSANTNNMSSVDILRRRYYV